MFKVTIGGINIAAGFDSRDQALLWIDTNLEGRSWEEAQIERSR